ncbi:restriction endonuclease type 2-like protein [Rhizobium gallicum]|uniref:Restriction endonuclease type 2-like protein n=1 Tax=Rhizobium gallicum TaxID=56730 RepID=A0A1L5NE25_9HYPH|nr:type II restriction endonuclease [Rhizobium gallicum]APO66150.1 restriction endonuclease type 2-like protein [Rhizobium gallicum]
MSQQAEFRFDQPATDADLLRSLLGRADRVLVKKLSNNDRNWARQKLDAKGNPVPGKTMNNQAGPYIPAETRKGDFFLPLELMERDDGKEIWHRFIVTRWPQSENERRESHLVWYTSKSAETHLTGLPKVVFKDLLPASFLVMGRLTGADGYVYECLTIDSGSDEAQLLANMFEIDADFVSGMFEPAAVQAKERDRVLDFADQVIAAWLSGAIESFARENATMPVTLVLAQMAQSAFREKHGIDRIDPFALDNPGDVLREISRSIEWDLFREFQRRERSVELVRIILGDIPREISPSHLIRALVDEYPRVDALMLSAAQQRKSRAGYSYEHHIEAMLAGGAIPFEKQVIIEAKKRPDFILPSLKFMNSKKEAAATGLILSAKTTLRERWKQVEREMGGHRRLFLTTVDENIAGNAIEDMASFGVHLIIPESLKDSKLSEYKGYSNVLGFREFCDSHIKPHLPAWKN